MAYGGNAGGEHGPQGDGKTKPSVKVGNGFKMSCGYPQDRSGHKPGEGDNGSSMGKNSGTFTG